MTFSTENRKIFKLWNETNNNKNIIIKQKDDNVFIIDDIGELNKLDSTFPILVNLSTDFLLADTIVTNQIITSNVKEVRITINGVNENFIPYIHCEPVYRVGTSGDIPLDPDSGIPFDEEIGEFIHTNEIFNIDDNSVEYITSMFMEATTSNGLPEVEYRFICYLMNPNYYSD